MSGLATEHRAAKTAFAIGSATVVSIVLQLVTVPVCLSYWGKEKYGVWLALFAAYMLLKTLDAGFVTYVGNKVNLLYHENDAALRQALASAVWGCVVIAALQLAIFGLVFATVGISSLLGLSGAIEGEREGALALLVLITSGILTGSYLGVIHRLLIPAGMMYQATWWGMGFQVFQFGALMIAAMMQTTVLQASMLFVLSQVVIYLASAVYIRHKIPDYYPWWRGARLATGLRDLASSTLLTLGNVLQQAGNGGLIVLIAAISGPAAVPTFSTVRTMANLWTNVTATLTAPLFPDVVRYHARREGEKIVATNEMHWLLGGTTVNLTILMAFPALEILYGYWTAHAIVLDRALLCYLLASVSLMNFGALMSVYLGGINNLRFVLAAAAARACLALGLGALLFPRLGFAGLGIAVFAGELLAAVVLTSWFFRREVSRLGARFSADSLRTAALSTGSVLAYLGVESLGSRRAFPVYLMAIAGVLFAAYWGWRRLDPALRSRVIRILGRKT